MAKIVLTDTSKTRQKQLTVAQLHKRLTPIFNHWVRLRDTYIIKPFVLGETREPGTRWGICISCNRELPYEQLQAGHFVPAHFYYLKYDELNVNAQCQQCNGYRKSNPWGYMLGLAEKYDKSVPYELATRMHWKKQYAVSGLLEMIDIYKGKVGEME